MNIIHVCLTSSYTEGMNYQDNMLVKYNLEDGHGVTVISNCAKYVNGVLTSTEEEDLILHDGSRLIRLKYDKIINSFISNKIRKTKKLYEIIKSISPDVILFHGTASWELLTVLKYKKKNLAVKLYIDSHTDSNNSATNWISLNILHRLFYKRLTTNAMKYAEKILYVSHETKNFLRNVYKVPEKYLEFYPLGGTILTENKKEKYRLEKRTELNLKPEDIMFCHSGKFDAKKRTFELIKSFLNNNNPRFKLILIGVFTPDVEQQVKPLIDNDSKIVYLGWKNSEELIKYIAASDLYLQPGSQSATMQNAICAGTPVLIDNVESHQVYNRGNAFLVNNNNEIENVFDLIANSPEVLDTMSEKAYILAKNMLNYKKLANRITR